MISITEAKNGLFVSMVSTDKNITVRSTEFVPNNQVNGLISLLQEAHSRSVSAQVRESLGRDLTAA
jgi:hypothetical protein